MDWPAFGETTSEDFEYGVVHEGSGWRDHSKFGSAFRHKNVYSAIVGKNGIESMFAGASVFQEISQRDGDPQFAAIWSSSEEWALMTDGKEIVLLNASSFHDATNDTDTDTVTQEIRGLFITAENRKELADFVKENLQARDKAYFAYHKTDEYGDFLGGYFYSNQKRSVGSHLYVISSKAKVYFLEGLFSISEILDGNENPYGKRYSYRLYQIERPVGPIPVSSLFDNEYLRKKVSGGIPLLSVPPSDQIRLKALLSEANEIPLDDLSYLESVNESLVLDVRREAKFRGEQAYIRRFLFKENKFGVCIVCNEHIPVQLLVAAHVRRRSKCNDQMKLDYKNNVFPMCKLGCDDLFEKGFIGVNASGVFVRLWKEPLPLAGRVEEMIASIEGAKCTEYFGDSTQYFDWHFNDHRRG